MSPWGEILADAGHRPNAVVFADVETRAGQLIEPNNFWSLITGTKDYRERLAKERRPEVYKLLTDPHPPVLKRYKRKGLPETPKEVWEIFLKNEADKRNINRGQAKRYV